MTSSPKRLGSLCSIRVGCRPPMRDLWLRPQVSIPEVRVVMVDMDADEDTSGKLREAWRTTLSSTRWAHAGGHSFSSASGPQKYCALISCPCGAVKPFVPVVAISSDRALTSTNLPWIFRLPEGTALDEAVKLPLFCNRAGGAKPLGHPRTPGLGQGCGRRPLRIHR